MTVPSTLLALSVDMFISRCAFQPISIKPALAVTIAVQQLSLHHICQAFLYHILASSPLNVVITSCVGCYDDSSRARSGFMQHKACRVHGLVLADRMLIWP